MNASPASKMSYHHQILAKSVLTLTSVIQVNQCHYTGEINAVFSLNKPASGISVINGLIAKILRDHTSVAVNKDMLEMEQFV